MSRMSLNVLLAALIFVGTPAVGADNPAYYLYNLSDFTGTKPLNGAKLSLDSQKNEIYAIASDGVYIFNSSGMEVFRFESDPAIGMISDVAVLSGGDLLLLASRESQSRLVRCNFRGEPKGSFELKGLPSDFPADFQPARLISTRDRLYLVSLNGMRVVAVDHGGKFQKDFDIAKLLGLSGQQKSDAGIGAVAIDTDGSLLATLPITARVVRISPDGELSEFGRRGSAPGRFGVPMGIAVDKDGNIMVSDVLRCVILVFARDFTFLREFGTRSFKPEGLIAPGDLLADAGGRVYISQLRKRGVSVYQVGVAE